MRNESIARILRGNGGKTKCILYTDDFLLPFYTNFRNGNVIRYPKARAWKCEKYKANLPICDGRAQPTPRTPRQHSWRGVHGGWCLWWMLEVVRTLSSALKCFHHAPTEKETRLHNYAGPRLRAPGIHIITGTATGTQRHHL